MDWVEGLATRYGLEGTTRPSRAVYRPRMVVNELDQAGEAALYRALRRFWHPVAWADEVADRPFAARLLDEPIVLVRLDGEVRAFRDLCVHRGTALSLGWVDDGQLVCAYHGWTYDPDGACTRIPSSHGTNIPRKARITRFAAAEHAGLIWVALDEPAMPLPVFPEWPDETFRKIKIPQYDWHCSAARRVENFVDFSHFAWVHEGILGDRSRPEIPDHDVVRTDATLWFRLGIEEPASDVKGDAVVGQAGRIQREPSHYTVSMPFSVRLDQPLEGDRHFVLFVASCPLSAKETRNFTWNARNYDLDPARDQSHIDFQQLILEQDRVVVESQRPEELPIDLSEELHIKGVDRVSIDYRRWLGEIAAAEAGRAPRLGEPTSPSGS
jgi:phenylpropionate dioxygenase-like ring-hydroxylating dioxygenase large terminal subunit